MARLVQIINVGQEELFVGAVCQRRVLPGVNIGLCMFGKRCQALQL